MPFIHQMPNEESDMHKAREEKRSSRKLNLRKLLRYQWMVKHLPFILFLAMLAVVYIYNGHYADKVIRDIGHTGRELQELQYEYKSLKSEVMFRSKQSELAKAVEPFGLKELTSPAMVISDSAVAVK